MHSIPVSRSFLPFAHPSHSAAASGYHEAELHYGTPFLAKVAVVAVCMCDKITDMLYWACQDDPLSCEGNPLSLAPVEHRGQGQASPGSGDGGSTSVGSKGEGAKASVQSVLHLGSMQASPQEAEAKLPPRLAFLATRLRGSEYPAPTLPKLRGVERVEDLPWPLALVGDGPSHLAKDLSEVRESASLNRLP